MVRRILTPGGGLAPVFSSASLAVSWRRFNADIRNPRPPFIGRIYGLMRYVLKEVVAMERAFRNPLFLTGLPLAICGIAITAPGLWIPGAVLMIAGWAKGSKRT